MTTAKPASTQTKKASGLPSKAAIVAFQNMLVLNIDDIKKFGTSNVVRVGLYSRANTRLSEAFQKSYGLIDKNASPFCSDNALLELQPPREAQLAFLAEEYGRSTGKKLTSEKTFDFKLLGNQILGQVKAWRALMGFRAIGSALVPKGAAVNSGYYLEFNLPEVQIATGKLQGVIQGLNTRLYDKKMLQEDFAVGIPESIITTCFTSPRTLSKKSYNPLSNEVLNLGKNLFDFESMIHVGYASDRDRSAWEDAIARFLSSERVEPTRHTGLNAPSFEEVLNIFPQFKDAWAVSMHKLNLGGSETNLLPITGLNAEERAKQDAKTVQYALYSNNNVTRIIDTEEVTNVTATPFIKSFDLPSLYTNMTIDEIKELGKTLEKKQALSSTQRAKLCEALAYYRYINQCFIPVGNDVNVEVLLKDRGVEKATGIATSIERQSSNKTKGFEMDLGGSYAINLFEKNARIMSQGAQRNDALNFVADDNSKFMDVRLPPAYRKEGDSYIKLSIDYALAYSTNSNVVLLTRTNKDSKGLNEFNRDEFARLWGMFNANTDFKALRYNFEEKNPPLSGYSSLGFSPLKAAKGVVKTVGKGVSKVGGAVKTAVTGRESARVKYTGLKWADKVIIDRKRVTPSRLIMDAFYRLMNSQLNLYGKFYSNSEYKDVDKLDPYGAAIIEGLLDPEFPLFKTPFNMLGDKKFGSFTNALRGVLFDPKTMFTTRDFKKGTKNIQRKFQAFKLLPGSKEFLPGLSPEYIQKRLEQDAKTAKKAEQTKLSRELQAKNRAALKGLALGASKAKSGAQAAPNLCAKSFLIDSAFFSNVTDKKLPIPRFLPYTSGKISFPELDALNKPKTDGEFLRTLPSRTNNKQADRMTADSSSQHNIPALIPFIQEGATYWGRVKGKQLLPTITPRVFDPFTDKKAILDSIVFYHAAATNCGSLLCARDAGRMKGDVSIKTKPFLINPYTGDVIYDSPIIKATGLSGAELRLFESSVQLRKEYYAIRLLALLGSYFGRVLDKGLIKASPAEQGANKGFIIYEEVFGDMVSYMLNDFSGLDDDASKSSLEYLLTSFGKKGNQPRAKSELGTSFAKFVLNETSPFTKLIQETFGRLQSYKYLDSRIELISKCTSTKEVDEAFRDKELLAYIVDSQGYRPIDENEISEEARELARRYYCSLSAEQKTQLKIDATKISVGKTQATLAMLNPDIIELDEETKKMLCSQVGRMRIMDVKGGDAFIARLKEIYHNSDKELQDALQKMACDKISVQESIKAAEQQQERRVRKLAARAETDAQAEDRIADAGALSPMSQFTGTAAKIGLSPGMLAASIAGLGVVSYFSYKLLTTPKQGE